MSLKRDSMDPVLAQKNLKDSSTDEVEKHMRDTHIGENGSTQKDLSFTSLPGELRNNIYNNLLDTELVNVGEANVSYNHSIKNGMLQFRASRAPFPVSTAFFYSSKSTSEEARSYFYSKNLFIRLVLYTPEARHAKTMLEDSGVLFSVAAPAHVAASTQHALDITITEKTSTQKRAEVMFPAQYLPRLLNFLDSANKATKSWGPAHSISIQVRNAYDFPIARLQGDLLEPWRILTNLGSVKVSDAKISATYAKGLQRDMTSASFNPETWLANVVEMKEQGNVAFQQSKFAEATQYYLSAIITLSSAYRVRGDDLLFQPPEFSKKVQRLRWQCETNIAVAETKQGTDWLGDSEAQVETAARLIAAEEAASNALAIVTNNPRSNPWAATLPLDAIPPNEEEWYSDADKAKSWFRSGTVHMALREFLFAAGDLERAQKLTPEDKEIDELFTEARDKIDWMVRPGTMLVKAMKKAKKA